MALTQNTYQLSASSIEPYVKPLRPGALAMPIDTRDEQGRRIRLADDNLSGEHLLLVFLSDPDGEAAARVLAELADRAAQIAERGTMVLAISASSDAARNSALKRSTGFPCSIGCDASGGIFAAYGLHKGAEGGARLVLLTPYRQVRA